MDWYIGKYLRLDQTIRYLAYYNLETLFVMILLGAAELEQTGFVCFQELFEGRGGKGWWRGLT